MLTISDEEYGFSVYTHSGEIITTYSLDDKTDFIKVREVLQPIFYYIKGFNQLYKDFDLSDYGADAEAYEAYFDSLERDQSVSNDLDSIYEGRDFYCGSLETIRYFTDLLTFNS